jgi:hypothetical protein
MPEKSGEANLKKYPISSARRRVLHMSIDPCQGIAFRRAGKLRDSITRVAQLFG